MFSSLSLPSFSGVLTAASITGPNMSKRGESTRGRFAGISMSTLSAGNERKNSAKRNFTEVAQSGDGWHDTKDAVQRRIRVSRGPYTPARIYGTAAAGSLTG